MSEKTMHTPGPWKVVPGDRGIYVDGAGCGARVITAKGRHSDYRCVAMAFAGDDDREANAAHIVKCVNSHDALVSALEDYLGPARDLTDAPCHFGIGTPETCARCKQETKARAALALARDGAGR